MRYVADTPRPEGLYTPHLESDACGTGFVANLNGVASHQIVADALKMLAAMEHRGACGCEPNSGDGAGILVQVPHEFFSKKLAAIGKVLPEHGKYGVGMLFLPEEKQLADRCLFLFEDYADELGFDLIHYRKVPTDHEEVGPTSRSVEPRFQQVFVKPRKPLDPAALERRLFILRKYATHRIHTTYPETQDQFYLASFSYKTIVYKGQLTTWQLPGYYTDLQDIDFKSAIALVHSRFSTNTVPKWKLAQPFRMIAHNGEINTIQGNVNWWKSKESLIRKTAQFTTEELDKIYPVCGTGLSDSANFDNVLEFLTLNGISIPQALMMMVPEAWQHDELMPDYKKAFYQYTKGLMEPWDGPASICFTDGILVGATLDRNGLRPSRWCLMDDNVLIVASEAGALPVDQSRVVQKGRLQPGRILVADLEEHRIIGDEELKEAICQRLPYREWLTEHRITLEALPLRRRAPVSMDEKTLFQRLQLFGYTKEDLSFLLEPMIKSGQDPIGSMGADTPLAPLSLQSQHLSNYFKQLFAQVTNPPIDPIRERSVMSLYAMLGETGNIMEAKAENAKNIHLDSPVLTNDEMAKIKEMHHPDFRTGVINSLFPVDGQEGRLEAAIRHLKSQAESMVRSGYNILVISDRAADSNNAPIPSLLATGAVHHHLVGLGLRAKTSLVIEAGDVRETHHFATLIGYGASAINPYLTYAALADLYNAGVFDSVDPDRKVILTIYRKAIGKGLLKIMSKIGISTLQSYQGAQIFEILGLNHNVVDDCFRGSISRIEGIGYDGIAREVLVRHQLAYPAKPVINPQLEVGGVYQWKRRGEAHTFNPKSIHYLQLAARKNDAAAYELYKKEINDQTQRALTLRGLLAFRKGDPIPLEEVESAEQIMTRFATGAMSFGSISWEAHTTLAIAMNKIGARSNSGEGGEDEVRYEIDEYGNNRRSAIKQVASGRFGVTSHYLTNADEIQIKMAQGAKPGEGGQLPGHKVDDWIGRVRHSTPGVGLISPPPHHDIYSIEDLAQLIFDLKNANRRARINVKLVSKAGVGIIASGVAKAKADAILISGHDGGTGASPLSSIRHAGLPWELGLAETHQTLVKNKLRDRVVLQTDGQIRTGRDLVIATLLGAEEYGIATAALVVEGCIMMRKCHVNTCPVGIATQDPELRARFTGDPQHVINFFRFLAEDMRSIMAELGYRTITEMVGQVEQLKMNADLEHWKYKSLDLSPILHKEIADESVGLYNKTRQDHELGDVLDRQLITASKLALEEMQPVSSEFAIKNTDRAVGTMLSNEISRRFHGEGLPDGAIKFRFRGSAGQSFGAFGAKGIEFLLEGESNDYFGKGLSGGRLIVVPDRQSKFDPHVNIIIGNVAFYGATSGEAYIKGMAGERFCVRNSGVKTVVEGIGDHGCEYMTGGLVVVLGDTGKNFGAGMSGGMAYLYDPEKLAASKLNGDMAELEPLNDFDCGLLQQMVRNHFTYTSSKTALDMLNNWTEKLGHFVKVMPRDYKRVLEEKQLQPDLKVKIAQLV
ncbi:glutamate synthase large subunit [Neolewinella lacunae]|uniref:Glutamate synthase [NADPH] large chain n=1 Tax=Neolewinella lacunae TaxID=1517758 RepID=A0A923PJY5_9BACT|nr:glutamate synthase large subunit [Neolewinella lacunae]MBC6994724.1 glutamate synthase large subunit [Neolewinella lacunae]MDN3634596.1 glutamate synthase large subunit [Neolewinella lacunae]